MPPIAKSKGPEGRFGRFPVLAGGKIRFGITVGVDDLKGQGIARWIGFVQPLRWLGDRGFGEGVGEVDERDKNQDGFALKRLPTHGNQGLREWQGGSSW